MSFKPEPKVKPNKPIVHPNPNARENLSAPGVRPLPKPNLPIGKRQVEGTSLGIAANAILDTGKNKKRRPTKGASSAVAG